MMAEKSPEFTSVENPTSPDEINQKSKTPNWIIIQINLITTRLKKHSSLSFGVLVLALIYAHFLWATGYFLDQTEHTLDSTTCTGYGLWMILFILINFGIFYSLVLKKKVLPHFHKVWNPIQEVFQRIPYGESILLSVILSGILIFVIVDNSDDWKRLMALTGLAIYILIGFLICPFKSKIPWNTVLSGLIAQFILGLLMIRWDVGRNIVTCFADKVNTFLQYSVQASAFVYGNDLVNKQMIFAFNALAAIYLVSFVVNILYYYGIAQNIVVNLGIILQWLLGTPICESVCSAANIFLGQSEAPFLLKPYLNHLTDSEIHSIMTSGFATVSGTVLAAYISFGARPVDLITSCVMSAPAALCFSKLTYPETETVTISKENIKEIELPFESVLDAAIKGAEEAAKIVIGICSNLIAFLAIVYFFNGVLSWLGMLVGYTTPEDTWTLELILGKVLIPLAYTMGVEWDDCEKVGQLIGIKTMVNEFVAFEHMKEMTLSPRSKIIATYAICGFSNPGSIGIQLSALGAFMPDKRDSLLRVVFRAFFAGAVVCLMTACIAGLLTPS